MAQIGFSAAWCTESIVLSLGKLATGQAGYYLDQAHGSLSRAQSVASGVEDYYLGGPEADGLWMGSGCTAPSAASRCRACWPVSIRRPALLSAAYSRRAGPGSI